MPGSAAYVSAKRALWSPTKLLTVNLGTAIDLGPLAPGTALGDPSVATADGFGRKAGTMASQDITIVAYGAVVVAALVTAAGANPPAEGFIYITNKSGTRADGFAVSVVTAHLMPVTDDAARARVRYQFYADNDTVEDFHTVIAGTLVFPV